MLSKAPSAIDFKYTILLLRLKSSQFHENMGKDMKWYCIYDMIYMIYSRWKTNSDFKHNLFACDCEPLVKKIFIHRGVFHLHYLPMMIIITMDVKIEHVFCIQYLKYTFLQFQYKCSDRHLEGVKARSHTSRITWQNCWQLFYDDITCTTLHFSGSYNTELSEYMQVLCCM